MGIRAPTVLAIAWRSIQLLSPSQLSNRFLSTSVSCSSITKRSSDSAVQMVSKATGKREDLWQLYNEVIYPPVCSGRPTSETYGDDNSLYWQTSSPRPGEVTHRREDILYSRKKLWFIGFMICGLSVDEAFAQLGFRPEKGARVLEEVLAEAIDLAIKEHDFEFCTKMWIENIHVSRGRSVPRLHKGLRSQVHASNYHYANLYIRLREGDPPEIYHPRRVKGTWNPSHTCPASGRPSWGSGVDMLHRELRRLRQQKLRAGL